MLTRPSNSDLGQPPYCSLLLLMPWGGSCPRMELLLYSATLMIFTLGKPGSDECRLNLALMLGSCDSTGMPVEGDKCQGPVTCIPFLGMELDSIALEIQLPADKLANLRALLLTWRGGGKLAKKKEEGITVSDRFPLPCLQSHQVRAKYSSQAHKTVNNNKPHESFFSPKFGSPV